MIEVRPVTPDEHEQVAALTLAAYDGVGAVTSTYRESLADVAGRVADGAIVLVAVDGDEVLGSVTLVDAVSPHFEHGRHGDGGFRMLAVAPGAQGRGIGRRLLDAALDHARAAGWGRLAITTMEWMPTAHALYESVGFVRRPDLDVRFGSGVGHCYVLELVADAASRFPAPGPVPAEPPLFVPEEQGPPSC